jgi:predicted lipoprotein with Yx(FWY)xxD motif
MSRHTTTLAAAAATVVLAVAATACSGSDGNSSSSSRANPASEKPTPASVAEAEAVVPAATSKDTVFSQSGPLGTILFNQKGQTLYLFQKDKTSKSTCEGACATAWPPLIVTGKPTAGHGIKAKLLSTSTRSDGKKQVTYNGHPLYRFSGDTKAGQTNGQGVNAFGAKWFVLDTNGKQVTKQQATPGVSGY